MKLNLAIIGAGQIGSRHLQGIKKSINSFNIHIVDTNSNSLNIAKRRFEIENGRPPTGAEITALMKQSFQGVEEARMGKERVERAAETARNVSSQPWSSELDEKEEMRSPAY